MVYRVDTNVLLRLVDRRDARHAEVRTAMRGLRADGHDLRAAAQNFAEFWNVATRPTAQNGFGLSPADADRLLRIAERLFPLVPDAVAAYAHWRRLVVTYSITGVQVHDARLIATMIVYGITRVLTYDTADFARYVPEGIEPVDPANVKKT